MPVLSTIGGGADRGFGMFSLVSAPTFAFATLDPAEKDSKITLSNGNLTATATAPTSWQCVRSTISMSTNSWYCEATVNTGVSGSVLVGICTSAFPITTDNVMIGNDSTADGQSYYGANGNNNFENVSTGYGATYTTGDVIGIAFNAATAAVTYYKNGTSQGVTSHTMTAPFYVGCSIFPSNAVTFNFGATPFKYVVPSGFNYGLYTGSFPDGTEAIFALSNNGSPTLTNSYQFSSGTVATATALSAAFNSAACGNSTVGVFETGLAFTSTQTTSTYTYVGNVVTTGTNLSHASGQGSAAANSTTGIFAIGESSSGVPSSLTSAYTFSGNTVAAGTALSATDAEGAGTSNSTTALFILGVASRTTDLYTYSGATVAASTNLTVNAYGAAAVGNGTEAIIGTGSTSIALSGTTTTNKYLYAGATMTAGTSFTTTFLGGAGGGNSLLGIFALGGNSGSSTTNKYTYSGDTCVAGTALTTTAETLTSAGATSNGIHGVTL